MKPKIIFFFCILLTSCTSDTSQPFPIRPTVSIPNTSEIVDEQEHELVLIPGGIYYSTDHWWSFLDSFYIDKYEVTIGQYFDFLNSMDHDMEDTSLLFNPDIEKYQLLVSYSFDDGAWIVEEGSRNFPIVGITWYGAQAYCEWRDGELPSKDQITKASRGKDHRPYPWGYDAPDCERIGIGDCTEGWLHQVGQFPAGASPYGILDLISNVAEWSSDSWSSVARYDDIDVDVDNNEVFVWGSPIVTPKHVLIGPGFSKDPSSYAYYVGFRCVKEP